MVVLGTHHDCEAQLRIRRGACWKSGCLWAWAMVGRAVCFSIHPRWPQHPCVCVCMCKGQERPQAPGSVAVVLAEDELEASSLTAVSTSGQPQPPSRKGEVCQPRAWAVRDC